MTPIILVEEIPFTLSRDIGVPFTLDHNKFRTVSPVIANGVPTDIFTSAPIDGIVLGLTGIFEFEIRYDVATSNTKSLSPNVYVLSYQPFHVFTLNGVPQLLSTSNTSIPVGADRQTAIGYGTISCKKIFQLKAATDKIYYGAINPMLCLAVQPVADNKATEKFEIRNLTLSIKQLPVTLPNM